jgi:hypothetical protein
MVETLLPAVTIQFHVFFTSPNGPDGAPEPYSVTVAGGELIDISLRTSFNYKPLKRILDLKEPVVPKECGKCPERKILKLDRVGRPQR